MFLSASSCAALLIAFTNHIGSVNEYNETHPSIGVTCKESDIGAFSAGYYYNSEKDDTLFAMKRWYLEDSNFYAEAGVVVGYDRSFLLPAARIGYSFEYAEVFVAPGVETSNQTGETNVFPLIGIQFKFSF
ncbi:hypothetical protein [Synechococcus phage BUCT-ZZ01]|nr:hypothetical protein [Synechococcus phage BUCT-ZZ01]